MTVHPTPNAEMVKQEYTVAVMVWDKSSYFVSGTGIVHVTDSDEIVDKIGFEILDYEVK